MLKRLVLVVTIAACGAASVAIAQSPIEPKLAEQTMQTHPGWSAAVIASEPVVIDPVAIRFDRQRRLWVVEMSDYPTGPKPGQPPSGRIRILEDHDQDGRYETATTFADQLLFPTGVQPWRDGAIVTLAGKIIWMQDRDQNGVAETFEVWFEGFATENEQLRANHPVLGPDGMVYVAGGLRGGKVRAVDARFTPSDLEVDLRDHDFCFDPDGGTWRAITGNSQFGTTIDDYGRRIGCSNRNPAFTTILDDAAIERDVLLAPRDAVDDIALAGEASRVNPRTDAWTTSNLHAGQFSAACGVAAPGWFDDGSQSGEWLLVCEPTGSLIQRQWINDVEGVWRSTRDPRVEEFLSSTDSWFRPVDIVAGPGQAVYVADMVRAVIEHPQWAPVELKNRPDTWDGNDRGRLWSLAPASIEVPDPVGAPDVSWLGHTNPWVREMASQYFLEVAKPMEVAEALRSVIADPQSPPTAVARAALWFKARQLHGLDSESLQHLLTHEHPAVVCVGIQSGSTEQCNSELLARLAAHPSARVRLAIAAKLAAQPSPDPQTIALIQKIAEQDGDRPVPRKVLGSVDDSQLPELCRSSARRAEIPTELVRHWWTRWTVVAREDALVAIFPGDSDLHTQADPASADADDRTVALLEAWIRGNQMAGEKRLSRAAIQNTIGKDRLAELQAVIERVAIDAKRSAGTRASAVRAAAVLGHLPESFWTLLDGDQPADVRSSALVAWFSQDVQATCEWLDDELLTLSPALRAAALEQAVARPESTRWLLDRIESGEFRASLIPPQLGKRLMDSKDAAVAARAKGLFNVSSDREALMARYRSSPIFAGGLKQADAQRGKKTFLQACSACHRIDGAGVNVGPDISDSRDKTPEAILTSILQPNAAIDAAYFQYTALTLDGRLIDGLLIDDRAEGVTLRRQGGEDVFVPRDQLERLQASGTSLMPDGFERLVNEEEMAHLVAYLKNWRYLTAAAK